MAKRPGRQPTEITLARDAAVEKIGGIDKVYDMVAAGMLMPQIAEALGISTSRVSAHSVRQLLLRDDEKWEAAKKASADALAERGYEVLGEEAPVTTADAKWRSDRSKWFQFFSQQRSGMREQKNMTIHIGELHLSALKQAGSRQAIRQRGPADAARAFLQSGPVLDAEILNDDT
jgi:hypothetical protein